MNFLDNILPIVSLIFGFFIILIILSAIYVCYERIRVRKATEQGNADAQKALKGLK